MFQTQSVTTTINGQPVKIHGFSTGEVSVKTKFLEASWKGFLAQLNFVVDKVFTDWLPVWVWVIEHPEGIYIIDTGISAEIIQPGYFKVLGMFSNWVNTTLFKFRITGDQTLDQQLKHLGITIEKVKAVILTHLHIDHVDGLKYFPVAQIMVNKLEWEKPEGDVPKLYPSWFAPTLIELNEPFDVFTNSQSLTKSGDLVLIQTPGHTNGHASVLLRTDQADIIFAGDICYYQEQLIQDMYAGANVSFKLAKDSYGKILDFAKRNNVVYLPSHDQEAAERLKNLSFLRSE